MKEKKTIVLSNKQCIIKKNNIKSHRSKNDKKYNILTSLMDPILVTFGIDRERYHGGDLEVPSILTLFQNSNKIVHAFQTKIITIITDDTIEKIR